jgi:hypothetical protein
MFFAATISSFLSVGGGGTISGTLRVTDSATVSGDLNVGASLIASGSSTLAGSLSLLNTLSLSTSVLGIGGAVVDLLSSDASFTGTVLSVRASKAPGSEFKLFDGSSGGVSKISVDGEGTLTTAGGIFVTGQGIINFFNALAYPYRFPPFVRC